MRGAQHLDEISKERREELRNINANINFGAYVVETIGSVANIVAFFLGINNVILVNILGLTYLTMLLIMNLHYLMHDRQIKEIVMYRGWLVGFRSIFKTFASKEAMIQNLRAERRGRVVGNQTTPRVLPSSSSKSTKNIGKRISIPLRKITPSSVDEEYLCFKTFCRQSLINTMLESYKTNPLQFDVDVRNFVELERTCHDNGYHFDNNVFVSLFNKFTLTKKGRSVPLDKSGCSTTANKCMSEVPLNAQSLIGNTMYNVELILQHMLNHADNEDAFSKLFEQFVRKEMTSVPFAVGNRMNNVKALNNKSRKRTDQKDKPSKIKKSKTKTNESKETNNVKVLNSKSRGMRQQKVQHSKIRNSKRKTNVSKQTAIKAFSRTYKEKAVRTNKNSNNYPMHHIQFIEKSSICEKKKNVQCTNESTDTYCGLNVPDYSSNI